MRWIATVVVLASVLVVSACQSDEPQAVSDAIANADPEVFIEDDGSVNVNVTEADFRADFLALTAAEKIDVCEHFWSLSEAEFDDEMYAAGYGEQQIIASWNVLVEMC